MRRAWLAGAFISLGCGAAGPPGGYVAVYEPGGHGCVEPTDDDLAHLQGALEMWAEWGVDLFVGEWGEAGTSIGICLVEGVIDGQYGGTTAQIGHRARIMVNRLTGDRRYYTATLAHELGHVVLHDPGIPDHLPDIEEGVMSSGIDCGPEPGCPWSGSDALHLHSFGLRRPL